MYMCIHTCNPAGERAEIDADDTVSNHIAHRLYNFRRTVVTSERSDMSVVLCIEKLAEIRIVLGQTSL